MIRDRETSLVIVSGGMISRPSVSRLLTEPAVFLFSLFDCLLNFGSVLLQ